MRTSQRQLERALELLSAVVDREANTRGGQMVLASFEDWQELSRLTTRIAGIAARIDMPPVRCAEGAALIEEARRRRSETVTHAEFKKADAVYNRVLNWNHAKRGGGI